MNKDDARLLWIFAVPLLIVVGAFVAWPQYNVYSQRLAGEARLREAESSRQIAVEEAKAKLEAATMLAQAEVERSRGIAEANKIVGESLKGNHEYLVWLWIDKLDAKDSQVIYIPTEAGIPILEASRLMQGQQEKHGR